MEDYPLWFRLLAGLVAIAAFIWASTYRPRGRE